MNILALTMSNKRLRKGVFHVEEASTFRAVRSVVTSTKKGPKLKFADVNLLQAPPPSGSTSKPLPAVQGLPPIEGPITDFADYYNAESDPPRKRQRVRGPGMVRSFHMPHVEAHFCAFRHNQISCENGCRTAGVF